MKYSLILLLISNLALADDAKYLRQNDLAPFSGYLISPEKAEKIRLMDIDLNTSRKIVEGLNEENQILDLRLKAAKDHIDFQAKELVEARDQGFFTKTGYFLLGAIITGLISYGAAQAYRR
jgi:hypothetical protein